MCRRARPSVAGRLRPLSDAQCVPPNSNRELALLHWGQPAHRGNPRLLGEAQERISTLRTYGETGGSMKTIKRQTTDRIRRGIRHGQARQRGVAAVEFALVLPILLLIVFGIVEFGVAFYDKAVITNASREGARAGVVLKSPKATSTDIQNVVLNYTSSHLLTFGTQRTPTVTTTGQGGTFGTPLTVTVSYPYSGLALGQLAAALSGQLTLSATTVMNNE